MQTKRLGGRVRQRRNPADEDVRIPTRGTRDERVLIQLQVVTRKKEMEEAKFRA